MNVNFSTKSWIEHLRMAKFRKECRAYMNKMRKNGVLGLRGEIKEWTFYLTGIRPDGKPYYFERTDPKHVEKLKNKSRRGWFGHWTALEDMRAARMDVEYGYSGLVRHRDRFGRTFTGCLVILVFVLIIALAWGVIIFRLSTNGTN